MRDDDPRTEEQADADWRRVTDSLFDTNTREEPKVGGEALESELSNFVPNWGTTYCPFPKNPLTVKRDGQRSGLRKGVSRKKEKLTKEWKEGHHRRRKTEKINQHSINIP